MSRRPSVFVLALTVGDYLLWNWSLSANHDVLALVSGLTLPPLVLVSLWILAAGAMRLVAALAAGAARQRARAASAARPRRARASRRAGRRGAGRRRVHANRRLSPRASPRWRVAGEAAVSPRRKRLFSAAGGCRGRSRAPSSSCSPRAALGIYLYERHRTGSVYHPHAPFTAESTPTALPKRPPDRFSWPNYGYTKDHSRFFPAPESVRPAVPPAVGAQRHELLEFPPVIYAGRLFQLGDNAVLTATNKHTGKVIWKRKLGRLSASSPAVTSNTVYVTVLDSGRGAPGRIFAINSRNGSTRWSRALPSRAESSPLVDRGRVFFGSENGTVYALDDSNGSVAGPTTPGRRQGEPDALEGVLYFGDYSGHLQAVSERNGHLIWRSGSGGRCSAAAPSTRPAPSSTAASTSATPTGASTPTTPRRGTSTGPSRPAPTSTPPRR